ncbi:MAG: S1C family serine protease [Dehalococcoidales bacterium]
MKNLPFRIAIGSLAVIIAGAAFIAGCSFNISSPPASTTQTQNATSSVITTTSPGTVTQASTGDSSITTIYNADSPAIVEINISIYQGPYFPPATGQGSGFLIDTNGDIVTNNHVVEGASSVTVTLQNGKTVNAVVVGTDATDDLAVVKIAASSVAGITPLQFDDSNAVQVGQTVIAIGSPYGLMNSVTTGIISGLNRTVTEADSYSYTYNNLTGMLQTDAAVNPGNSGGPLLDTNGRVIGINTEIQNSSDGGIAFAVPSDTVEKVLPNLIKGTTAGASS